MTYPELTQPNLVGTRIPQSTYLTKHTLAKIGETTARSTAFVRMETPRNRPVNTTTYEETPNAYQSS